MHLYRNLCFLLFFFSLGLANAQEIAIRAGRMKGEKRNGDNYQILTGDVQFEQNGNLVTCDEAEFNTNTQELNGRGNVRINSSEGAVITGSTLLYNNKSKVARVEGGVVLRDKEMTLTTPWINYNTESKIGYYGSGGRIVDGEQILTSTTGSYNPNLKMLFFRYNVVLAHPDYKVKTDTLQYSTASGNTWFFNYTEITSEDNTILCNYGNYNSRTGKSYFTRNAAIISKENIIRADTLTYDRNTGIGTANGRLWVKDTLQRITIFGTKGYYNRKTKFTRVTGKPIARQYEKSGDSLMLKADTFIYLTDTLLKKRFLIAYRKVKMWKTDFSGYADSLSYVAEDSVFSLYKAPVLWNANTRLNADTIKISLSNGKIRLMQMRSNSFVVLQEDETHFSQISGRDMDNRFNSSNRLQNVLVTGSGRSIYFIKEKDTAVTAANVVQYNKMLISLDSNKVSNVRFYGSPEGNIYPLDQLPTGKEKLTGFIWDEENQPQPDLFKAPFAVPDLPRRRSEAATAPKRKTR